MTNWPDDFEENRFKGPDYSLPRYVNAQKEIESIIGNHCVSVEDCYRIQKAHHFFDKQPSECAIDLINTCLECKNEKYKRVIL
jgi:hypothetical protein